VSTKKTAYPHIITSPRIAGGAPIIKGTRIAVRAGRWAVRGKPYWGSEPETKKRARTAGAQVLLLTGFGCSPTTGRELKTTIPTGRKQQKAEGTDAEEELNRDRAN